MKLSKFDMEQLRKHDAQDTASYHEKLRVLAKFDPQRHPGKSIRQISMPVIIYISTAEHRFMMSSGGKWDKDVPVPPSPGRLFYSQDMFIIIAQGFSPLRAFANGQIASYRYYTTPHVISDPWYTWDFANELERYF